MMVPRPATGFGPVATRHH